MFYNLSSHSGEHNLLGILNLGEGIRQLQARSLVRGCDRGVPRSLIVAADGGSPGNPGPARYGAAALDATGRAAPA